MDTTIPGKQLHIRGTKSDIIKNLLPREIGWSDTDSTLYIKIDGQLRAAVPYLQAIAAAKQEILTEIGKPLKWIGDATVEYLNGTITGLDSGWTYTLTDGGTLTAGNVSVEPGDEVAWSEASNKWVKIGGDTGQFVVLNGRIENYEFIWPSYAEINAAILKGKMVCIVMHSLNDELLVWQLCYRSFYMNPMYYMFIGMTGKFLYIYSDGTYEIKDVLAHTAAIAHDYDPNSTYPTIGTAVMQNGVRYVSNTPITAAEPWTPSHWTECDVESALTSIKSLANSKYSLPVAGIPKTDLAQGVRDSLGLADTALQSVPTFAGSSPGLVPTATASDSDKALRGDGTWGDVSNASVSYDSATGELSLDFSIHQNNGGN